MSHLRSHCLGRLTNLETRDVPSAALPSVGPVRVASITINDQEVQRSMVTSINVEFNRVFALSSNAEEVFELTRLSDGANINLIGEIHDNIIRLTFTGPGTEGESLGDGLYVLRALAWRIETGNFDGNGDGQAGDDYILLPQSPAGELTGVYRLFGDANGDGHTNLSDLNAFRSAVHSADWTSAFDANGDGFVDLIDFVAFRRRLGTSLLAED